MTRARDLAAFVSNADGDIKFDTDTLFIDSSANRVGIGTNSPSSVLHVSSSDPELILTDTDSNVDHSLDGNSGTGILRLHVDKNSEGSGAAYIINMRGTEAMRIDNSANVGIGTSPATKLDVDGGANSDHATFSGTAGRGLKISTATGGAADEVVDFDAQASGTTQALTFSTGGTERARINQDGILTANNHQIDILDGSGHVSMRLNNLSSAQNSGRINIDPDNSGSGSMLAIHIDGTEEVRIDSDGLKFNGDSAAANALDDYEEGTFTPVFNSVTAPTFTNQDGKYTKIGNVVNCTVEINVASGLDTSDGSGVTIGGLPFTAQAGEETALASLGRYTSLLSGRQTLVRNFRLTSTAILLLEGSNDNIQYSNCATSGLLQMAFTYRTT